MFNLDRAKKNIGIAREKLLKNFKNNQYYEDDRIDYLLNVAEEDVKTATDSIYKLVQSIENKNFQIKNLEDQIERFKSQSTQVETQKSLTQRVLILLQRIRYSERFLNRQEVKNIEGLISELQKQTEKPNKEDKILAWLRS